MPDSLTPQQQALLRRGNIDSFFNYYSARLEAAKALATTAKYTPEVHILIGAGLDALAKSWAENIGHAYRAVPGPERWQAFMSAHANADGFMDHVAVPLLADDLAARKKYSEAEVVQRVGRDGRDAGVRFVDSDDPTYTAFVSKPEIAALAIEKDIQRFRFGAVLYVEHRCAWSHRMLESEKIRGTDPWGDAHASRVAYENYGVVERGKELAVERLAPIFTLGWLLARWSSAIESYRNECIARDADPIAAGLV
jgi:hypothetical protein